MFTELFDYVFAKPVTTKPHMSNGVAVYKYNTANYYENLLVTRHNEINIGNDDYLLVVQYGMCLPEDEKENKCKTKTFTNTDLLNDVVKNKKYLVKLNPKIHKTYQDLVHEFLLESKKIMVKTDPKDDPKSVYDYFGYNEYLLNGHITVYTYQGINYWNIDLNKSTDQLQDAMARENNSSH